MKSHETKKPKYPVLHFAPEGYVSSGDVEYLDQLIGLLNANHIDPSTVVFSGFKADAAGGQAPARHNAVYVMNEAGWRYAVKIPGDEANPAEYAERLEGVGVPCLGLYATADLIQVDEYDPPQHPENIAPPISDIDPIRFEGTTVLPFEADEAGIQHFDDIPLDEFIEEREEFTKIIPGLPLSEIPLDEPLETAVIHKDYPQDPNASPTDALVGLVYLEEPPVNDAPFAF